MPLRKGAVSQQTRDRMSEARKKLWREDKGYADTVRKKRVRLKFAQLHGAFSGNPIHEQPLEEFDSWTW